MPPIPSGLSSCVPEKMTLRFARSFCQGNLPLVCARNGRYQRIDYQTAWAVFFSLGLSLPLCPVFEIIKARAKHCGWTPQHNRARWRSLFDAWASHAYGDSAVIRCNGSSNPASTETEGDAPCCSNCSDQADTRRLLAAAHGGGVPPPATPCCWQGVGFRIVARLFSHAAVTGIQTNPSAW